jgi:hypothetical protein
MPTEPRWTDETEDLVREHAGVHQVNARAVLSALADAGLLLPPGGETYDQYTSGNKRCCQLQRGSANFVHAQPRFRHTHYRTETAWPDGTVHTGPWREVEVPDRG